MNEKDKKRFAEELTLTIQCVSGTMRPPPAMLKAYWDVLKDLETEQVIKAVIKWRERETQWPAPAAMRIAVVGKPHLDSFDEYMEGYVSRGRTGAYSHPIGSLVIKAMGGSRRFTEMTTFDRAEFKRKWGSLWQEIDNGDRPGADREADAQVSKEPQRVQ